MEIRVLGHPSFEGVHSIESHETLKSFFNRVGGQYRPKLIQVGGALGQLFKDYDIQYAFEEVENNLIEPTISYFDAGLCVVDFMRFMTRFVIRELNIVNDTLRTINDLIEKMTTNKSKSSHLNYLKSLLEEPSETQAEKLLKRNILYLFEHFEIEIKEHVDGFCRHSICRGLFDAQCINSCPAHIHIPGFVALMKDNNLKDAYQLMRRQNPLSSVCGSVCARPCEIRCRRGEITSTVGVRALQRFISIEALKGWSYDEKIKEDNHKSVAIIGGGPSGLTAAYYLKKTGYAVTIYEKQSHSGGMLAFGVPSYRLPLKSIEDEIKTIEKLGVEIKLNQKVDEHALSVIKQDYDAVILATGTTVGNKLPLNHGHVLSGIDFLRQVRLEKNQTIGNKVVVVGGGDVALDCARTAIRFGSEVLVISLETYDKMPASLEEKHHSKLEGVKFYSGYGINHITDHHIMLKECVSVFDDAGKFSPEYVESSTVIKDVDTIIMAIGQKPDTSYLEAIYKNDRGFVKASNYVVDAKMYACGDVLRPTIVIDAIAQGKKVAEKVDLDLNGTGLYVGEAIEIPEKALNIRTFDYDLREEDTLDPFVRVKSFEEVTKVYSLEDALYEANRCMRCDRNSKSPLMLGR